MLVHFICRHPFNGRHNNNIVKFYSNIFLLNVVVVTVFPFSPYRSKAAHSVQETTANGAVCALRTNQMVNECRFSTHFFSTLRFFRV